MENDLVNLNEAAKMGNVTRQAVYKAVRKGSLPATRINGNWFVSKKDYKDYLNGRFNRDNSLLHTGEKKFDNTIGEFSIKQCQKYIELKLNIHIPFSRLYYLVYTGQIRSFKKASSWVILEEDLNEYIKDQEILIGYAKKFSIYQK